MWFDSTQVHMRPGRKHIKVAAVDLIREEVKIHASLNKCSAAIGIGINTVRRMLSCGLVREGWYVCLPEDLEARQDLIRALSIQWAKAMPRRQTIGDVRGKVQLRIDDKTVIWVKPEEATEQFIESYKIKLSKR